MKITELLKIKYPIIQGAMARIADASLAASVSNAGGLGIIASGGLSKEELGLQIDRCRSLTDQPFGVNLMLMMDNCKELVEVILEKKVPVVTTGAGSPAIYMDLFKQNNVIVIPVIPTVAIAKKMESIGASAVIAEGMEAGGHIGKTTTMSLLPQVVDAVTIPVIGAGGIADGRGMAACFALGASGVQIGTRFVASKECNVHDNYKQMLLHADDTSTVVTGQSGNAPVRCLKNKMTDSYIELEKGNPTREELEKISLGSLGKAVEGDLEGGSFMAGQIVGMIHDIKPVKEIIDDLIDEMNETVNKLETCIFVRQSLKKSDKNV